jgi:hypothetical protein
MKVNYKTYTDFCKLAVDNDEVFKSFKRHPHYTYMLEHVTEEMGWGYLHEIEKEYPYLLDFMPKFTTNDNLGEPNMYSYGNIGLISPTTLRYVKVLADILNIFGRYDNFNILEIGVGYGGQCKILHDFGLPMSYTMVDLPEVLALARKCNELQKVNNIVYKTPSELEVTECDLVISNYAFTEIERKYQEMYVEKVITNAKRGYITCNYFGKMDKTEALSREEVFSLKEHYEIFAERPLTGQDNLIYTWK